MGRGNIWKVLIGNVKLKKLIGKIKIFLGIFLLKNLQHKKSCMNNSKKVVYLPFIAVFCRLHF